MERELHGLRRADAKRKYEERKERARRQSEKEAASTAGSAESRANAASTRRPTVRVGLPGPESSSGSGD